MAGAAKYAGAVAVTLIGILVSSISLLPVAVDRLEFNSASLSRELQSGVLKASITCTTGQDP